jgi:trk system potassium uptake protein
VFVGIGGFLYVLDGIDALTATGLVSSMVNNVGLGFRVAGPTGSCAFLSNFSLLLSSVLMIFGRLEFLILLAVLTPGFWKQTT